MRTTPSPETHTLFLKHQKLTVLLYASPCTPLPDVKASLHSLLSENTRHLTIPLPSSSSDIILAATIDPSGTDVRRGFRILKDQDNRKTTVQDAGLRDGFVLAWNVGGKEFKVEVPVEEEYEDE
ncbi:hypothetical protein BZA77DRAFT_388299 [Pyronema omphalodes]|nr:hypothetical protein BZA77DRAFT_388299 [Pyronema omphalodes]